MTLKEKFSLHNIILASNSPRRKQFLTDLGLDFTIKPANVDESFPLHLKDKDIALYIAEQKVSAFPNLDDNDIVITCDTVVWLENQSFGKPETLNEAKQMLMQLSGKTHQVISAVCIKTNFKTISFYDSTDVTFNHLENKTIDYYVETYNPLDKAGAYGIQEWIGLVGIEKINGSYTNVVGMPMEKLYQHLIQL